MTNDFLVLRIRSVQSVRSPLFILWLTTKILKNSSAANLIALIFVEWLFKHCRLKAAKESYFIWHDSLLPGRSYITLPVCYGCCSVAKSSPSLCDPEECSIPGWMTWYSGVNAVTDVLATGENIRYLSGKKIGMRVQLCVLPQPFWYFIPWFFRIPFYFMMSS